MTGGGLVYNDYKLNIFNLRRRTMEDKQELLNALYVIRAGISVASQINDKIWDEQ